MAQSKRQFWSKLEGCIASAAILAVSQEVALSKDFGLQYLLAPTAVLWPLLTAFMALSDLIVAYNEYNAPAE